MKVVEKGSDSRSKLKSRSRKNSSSLSRKKSKGNGKPSEFDLFKRRWVQKRNKNICKPCWEINYCPYGPLVEIFPFPPPARNEAIDHDLFLKQQMKKGVYDRNPKNKKKLQGMIDDFDPFRYPLKISKTVQEKSCTVFGHICPVFFVSEPYAENNKYRIATRHISRAVMIRVVRRDNSTCQICGTHLLDDEIQFDHIIPVSRGGRSDETNVRLTCADCNLRKSDMVSFTD